MKYVYESLCVVSSNYTKYFGADQLHDAIAYLRNQSEQDLHLIARTYTTVGRFRLCAEPALTLDQIIGKTPADIWAAFDAEVDLWAAGREATYPRVRPIGSREKTSFRSHH